MFMDALGPMANDSKKVQQVLFFIHAMRAAESEELPTMSFEEMNDCIPLDEAFRKLEEDVRLGYNL